MTHRLSRYHPTIYRTRFAKDIVAEVALPERETGRVIVLAQGLPSSPSKRAVLEFLVGEGYAVVFPRYRGTWESGGYFLEHSPTEDIRLVIEALSADQKFWCTFSQVWIPLRAKKFYIIGSSFGGPAAAWMSELLMVKKVALLSPVIDWQTKSEIEPFDELVRFTHEGFGMAIRPKSHRDWKKLRTDTHFYSFPANLSPVAKKKIFLMHCMDDRVVSVQPALDCIQAQQILFAYLKPHGGHLGISHLTQLFFWNKIQKFFESK